MVDVVEVVVVVVVVLVVVVVVEDYVRCELPHHEYQ